MRKIILHSGLICHGIAIDSRNYKPDQLFFALKGNCSDGHFFLKDIAEKGGKAAIVSKDYQGKHYGLELIYVSDVLSELHLMTKKFLSDTRIIAITGSLGKTTTKDFIYSFLQKKYKVAASFGNHNSQIGLPLTVLNHTNGDEDVIILEMGITHSGDLKRLIEIAPPEIAVLTLVEYVHAGNFNSIEEIAKAKSEIFLHPKTQIRICYHEIPIELKPKPSYSFSISSSKADFYLNSLTMSVKGHTLPQLNLRGKHNLHNLLAAIVTARCMDISWEDIITTIPNLTLPERRLEEVQKKGILFINDSYNAATASIKSALVTLSELKTNGKKIAVLGGIKELGKFSEENHFEIGKFALKYVDIMLCIGEECRPIYEVWKNLNRDVTWAQSRGELVQALKNKMNEGDCVLLKGSRVWELWKVLDEV